MQEELDDYTKAEFPFDTRFANGGKVRLLAALGTQVIGFTHHGKDGEEPTSMSMALLWNGEGIYGGGGAATLNLVPPPAKIAARIAKLEAQIAEAQARLDTYPDAPDEWRERDLELIESWRGQISKLAPLQPEPETVDGNA